MLDILKAHDRNLVEISCGCGSILIPPLLNGRIFCQLDGELIHRLDVDALQNPSPTDYDNLGGNSLWPAPEGGPFAFNYPPGGGPWYVQDGIAKDVPTVVAERDNSVRIEKRISLTNRKGVRLDLDYRRTVTPQDVRPLVASYDLQALCYRTLDVFDPRGRYAIAEVLLAPWSLEQFPGAEDIVAFGKVADVKLAINTDFYGDPGDRITRSQGHFIFRLGGKPRYQIGVRAESGPQLIGALNARRSLLVIRKTEIREGTYFNIADNDQTRGPFSAADAYSIFNGGELEFFELETIGAMQSSGGFLAKSALPSQTLILKGRPDELLRYLSQEEHVAL